MDDDNRLIFGEETSTKEGYKFAIFSGTTTTSYTVSAGKKKSGGKKVIKETERVNFIMDMTLSGVPRPLKNHEYLNTSFLGSLRRVIGPYLNEDGLFKKNCVHLLEKDLAGIGEDVWEPEDLMTDDPMGYYEDEDDDD